MVRSNVLTQISLFAENKPGRMLSVFKTLVDANVEVLAFTIAEAGTFGVFHLITDDPEITYKSLTDAGFTVSKTDVLGIELDDFQKGLYWISDTLAKEGISVDYAYTSISKGETPYLVMRVSDVEAAKKVFENLIR